MEEYKILTQMSFDWMIALYFFLGGISAGSFFFSFIANYVKQEFKSLSKTAAVISPVALAIGLFILLIDLGKPLRAVRLFIHFNPTSMLSWGVWFLNIFFVLSALYAWLLLKNDEEKAKRVAYPGLGFAALVAAYTGVLLAQAPARALWHSAMVPVLFTVGGLVSAVALIMLISAGAEERTVLAKLGKVLAWLVIAELSLTLIEVVILFNGNSEAFHAAKALVAGQLSFLFWGIQIILGAAIPAAILFRDNLSAKAQAVAAMLVLIGIYTMRYIIVVGGQVIS